MRVTHYVVAVAAVLLTVVGVKALAPSGHAKSSAGESATLNVLQMQAERTGPLPELKIRDMSLALD